MSEVQRPDEDLMDPDVDYIGDDGVIYSAKKSPVQKTSDATFEKYSEDPLDSRRKTAELMLEWGRRDDWNNRPADVTEAKWAEYVRLSEERGVPAWVIRTSSETNQPLPPTIKELLKLRKIKDRLQKMDRSKAKASEAEDRLERLSYRPKEVAFMTGYSLQTVYEFIRTGELPAIRKKRAYVVEREALINFLKNGGHAK